jgi:hypothetical protein
MNENEIFSGGDVNLRRRAGDDSASEAVVMAVAEALDCEPLDLPPLYEVVDPDVLDDVFDDTVGKELRANHLVFDYYRCRVALVPSDEILVDVED